MPAVSERVFRVQAPYDGNAVHLYFVRGVKLALIDSGAADSPLAAVEPALRELGLEWSDLDYLLNTHGHADHAGGNGELKVAAPEVEIAIHSADRYLLTGPEAHLHSPTDASEAMRLLGRDSGELRLPLCPMDAAGEAKVRQTLQDYGLLPRD